jgi:adhesin/invasin
MRLTLRRGIAGGFLGFIILASVTCGGGGDGGGGGGGTEPTPVPVKIEIKSGGGQFVEVGSAVPAAPSVIVKDVDGRGVEGVHVTFTITAGGGTVVGGTQVTDASGIASVTSWTIGTVSGVNSLKAAASVGSVTFVATGQPGPVDTLLAVGGDNQSGYAGGPIPVNPFIEALDSFANTIPSQSIAVHVTTGGGTVASSNAVTGSNGIVQLGTWTFGGLVGTQTLVVSAGSHQTTITATVGPGPVFKLLKVAGDSQSGVSGQRLPTDLQVHIEDKFGNPIPNQLFRLTSGFKVGRFFTIGSDATDANGNVSTGWAPGPAGTSVATFEIAGVQVTFTATTVMGPPALLVATGSGQLAQVATVPALPVGTLVTDLGGTPVPGVDVTFAALPGNGTVSGPAATTDTAGTALVGSWTLGTQIKLDTLTATSAGLPPIIIIASTSPGPSASLQVVSGDQQSALANRALAQPIVVRSLDQFGNSVPNAMISFSVQSGGGNLAVTADTTNAQGEAQLSGWTLGSIPGPNTVLAAVPGTPASVVLTAIGLKAPGRIVKVAGDSQVVVAGSQLPVDPVAQVLDTQDQPMAGVEVSFQIIGGQGSLSASKDTSDANGLVSVGWQVGTIAEASTLAASVSGVASATFRADAIPDAPSIVVALAGNGQSATVGNPLPVPPSVRVTDQFGNSIAGVNVDFAVTSGGGALTNPAQVTNAGGVAQVGSWTLGPAPGGNTLTATVALPGITNNPVLFTATGIAVPHNFAIDVRPLSSLSPSQSAAFASAATRLQNVIIGDIPNVNVVAPAGTCVAGQPAINEVIDDVVIFAVVSPIDGPGGILGQAGPCLIRNGSFLPAVGVMFFDVADLNAIEASGLLQDVILHEMQHVLGFGSIWNLKQLLAGAGTADPIFTGAAAANAFNTIGGANYPGLPVPVENTGGPGTQDSHWRESIFGNELMTGFVNAGTNPLSLVTVYSYADLSYQVDPTAADNFSIGPFPAPPAVRGTQLVLADDVWSGPLILINSGGTLRVIRR